MLAAKALKIRGHRQNVTFCTVKVIPAALIPCYLCQHLNNSIGKHYSTRVGSSPVSWLIVSSLVWGEGWGEIIPMADPELPPSFQGKCSGKEVAELRERCPISRSDYAYMDGSDGNVFLQYVGVLISSLRFLPNPATCCWRKVSPELLFN